MSAIIRSRPSDESREHANALDPAMVRDNHFGGDYHEFARLIAAPSATRT
jgi:hypothetical protein